MKVLSIDTSSKIASIAIIEDGRVLDEMHVLSEEEHSQTLMPMIEKIFNDNNMDLDEIDLIGCSRGPGSFTGIRIGIATAKAFSDAKNIPLIGIDSLEALAYSVVIEKENNDCEILAMINAKNDNVYAATYLVNNGKLNMVKNAEIMNLTETVSYIDFKKQVFIVGCEDEDSIRRLIQAEASSERAISGDDCSFEFVKDTIPTAASIGIAAYEKYKNGVIDEIIVPLYLRKPQAERNLFQVDEKTIVTEMAITDKEFIIDNYDKFSSSWDIKAFKSDADDSKYFVSKIDTEVFGYISYRVVLDEVEIMNVVTREDARNMGIASSLLSYLIRNVDASKFNLEVNENNKVAIKIYKKFGFMEVGKRKNYYNNGKENAILMSL
mgnify:FL=1